MTVRSKSFELFFFLLFIAVRSKCIELFLLILIAVRSKSVGLFLLIFIAVRSKCIELFFMTARSKSIELLIFSLH